jgi:uncharacterized membrane protein
MRLASTNSPASLLRLLGEIDATRAPLHPLLLQRWLMLFGTSELAGRSFSAVCGVATILLVYRIGTDAFSRSTGLWASWLAALSPLLVYYAREARMYAWLVLVTCACWAMLFRRSSRRLMALAPSDHSDVPGTDDPSGTNEGGGSEFLLDFGYLACLVALGYSHPLGLIMIATLASASGLFVRTFFGNWSRWLLVHGLAALMIAPWLSHYLDHSPEHLSGRLPIKFLLGTPIGFIGGNFVTLIGFLLLAAYGVSGHIHDEDARRDGPMEADRGLAPVCLLIWLVVPPLTLFVYSMISHPIFGPARYTLFVAPAYLILVALGLGRLPALLRYPLGIMIALLSLWSMFPMVYDPEIKGDWRAFAASLDGAPSTVIVMSADPAQNVEVETARYYLPADCTIVGSEAADRRNLGDGMPVYLTVGSKRGRTARPIPDHLAGYRFVSDRSFPGLAVFRGIREP